LRIGERNFGGMLRGPRTSKIGDRFSFNDKGINFVFEFYGCRQAAQTITEYVLLIAITVILKQRIYQ
jgi:hypothetical protein